MIGSWHHSRYDTSIFPFQENLFKKSSHLFQGYPNAKVSDGTCNNNRRAFGMSRFSIE